MRHLETRALRLQPHVAKGVVKVGRVPSDRNRADLGTKVVNQAALQKLIPLLNYVGALLFDVNGVGD
eukprot:8639333-Lingulodinium_polyedra.AAC.1